MKIYKNNGEILIDGSGATLLNEIKKAVAEKVSLRGANLSGADLSWADLSGADLSGADLRGANLSWADLSGADLSWADLRGANLSGANLRGADLRGADLSGADLRGANLSGADLRGANLSGADLSGADLRGANLSGADLIRIHGSRNEITAIGDDVRIGCLRHPIKEWLRHFRKIGKAQGYTPDEIAEYGLHLKHIAALQRIFKKRQDVLKKREAAK